MKVCEYCDTECDNDVTVCPACGANEFRHKCPNCGNEYVGGNFCPNCGVKAGSEAKKCPVCGKEYFSAACPDCGYAPGKSTTRAAAPAPETSAQTYAPAPQKKRRTWLWVLGWIFLFPVPVTVLCVRSKTLPKWAKIAICVAAWVVYLGLGAGNA